MAQIGSLAYLNSRLDTKLNDASDTVWTSAEKDELLGDAVRDLWPRVSRPLMPDENAVALTTNVFFYPLPQGVLAVSRADWLAEDGFDEYGELAEGLWSVEGDVLGGLGVLRVDPRIANQGGVLRLYGYGRYDTHTWPIPLDYVPLVLASAAAEAYRRLAGDRTRYTEWLSRQQQQNASVNELTILLGEAQREVDNQRRANKVWQRPVPARA